MKKKNADIINTDLLAKLPARHFERASVQYKHSWLHLSRWRSRLIILKSHYLLLVKTPVQTAVEVDWSYDTWKLFDLRHAKAANRNDHQRRVVVQTEQGETLVFRCKSREAASIWAAHINGSCDAPALEHYEPLRVIGQGGSGKVLLVRKRDGDHHDHHDQQEQQEQELYALKIVDKRSSTRDMKRKREAMVNERLALEQQRVQKQKQKQSRSKDSDHDGSAFLDQLRCAFQTSRYWFLLTDFAPGGDLIDHLKRQPGQRLTEEALLWYAPQLILGVEHMHKSGLMHRDLKPENVLIDSQGFLRICDFGLSKRTDGKQRSHSFCGTGRYLAPEMVHDVGYGHGFEIDWWGLAQLLYVMVYGRAPFVAASRRKTFDNILGQNVVFPLPRNRGARASEAPEPKPLSDLCQSFLSSLLRKHPSDRLGTGTRGSEDVKAHPWLSSVDWDAMSRRAVPAPTCIVLPEPVSVQQDCVSPLPSPSTSQASSSASDQVPSPTSTHTSISSSIDSSKSSISGSRRLSSKDSNSNSNSNSKPEPLHPAFAVDIDGPRIDEPSYAQAMNIVGFATAF